tara:strand:- start:64 stop:717 length:654 start_codon:yes stop_codon:yes gene_type:complete
MNREYPPVALLKELHSKMPCTKTKTTTTKTTEHSIKANCKRGYTLLQKAEADLTATQNWIIKKLLTEDPLYHNIKELAEFLHEFKIHIKVPMLTELKSYTNKKGTTSMKHYTTNGIMVNKIKSDVPVLFPTWIEFDKNKLSIETPISMSAGEWVSREQQTLFHWKTDEEEEEEDDDICGTCGEHMDDCLSCECPDDCKCLALCESEHPSGKCPYYPY